MKKITIKLEIDNCKNCPFYKSNRYGFCSKKFNSDVDAYQAGSYVEFDSDIDSLIKSCPFKE